MSNIRINKDNSSPTLDTGGAEHKRLKKYQKIADAVVTQFIMDCERFPAMFTGVAAFEVKHTTLAADILRGRIIERCLQGDGCPAVLDITEPPHGA
jgi:hypothetical protein